MLATLFVSRLAGHAGDIVPMHKSAAAVYDVQGRLNERFKSKQEAEGQKCLSSLCSQINQHVGILNDTVIPENGMKTRSCCRNYYFLIMFSFFTNVIVHDYIL